MPLKLILRNVLRHKVRAALTVLGLAVALVAFGVLSTVVGAWYAAAEKAAPTRLVTRNGVSLAFPLPLTYRDRIRAVDGVRAVSHATWFGGVYQNPKNFFAQFAIEPASYLPLYPEFLLKDEELRAFLRDRKGADHRPQPRPTPTASRSATACRCAARSSPATGSSPSARSTTAPRRTPTPRRCCFTGSI